MAEKHPARSRRGGGAVWIFLGIVAVLALALFGFGLGGGALLDPDPAGEAVVVDDGVGVGG